MTGQTESSFKKTWNILAPFLVYFVVHDLAQVLLAFLMNVSLGLFGGGYTEFMLANASSVNGVLNALALCIGMASVYPMARKEFQWAADGGETAKPAVYAALAVFAVSLALGSNILFTLTGLTASSEAYGEIAAKQYGVAFGVGILVYGILSPLAEEIVFRGLIYNRMKRSFRPSLSIIVCGILFGIYHGNLVQGIYGCILGIAITFSYELCGSFFAPVLFHSLANVSVFIAGYDQRILNGMVTVPNCIIFMTISAAGLFLMVKMRKKQDK